MSRRFILVGVLGVEPSQEHPSSAKGLIRPSRVPTPTPINGELGGTRTHAPLIKSQILYQLSYEFKWPGRRDSNPHLQLQLRVSG